MIPAYVLNLDRREDRWLHMQREWGSTFALRRFSATDASANGRASKRAISAAIKDTHLRALSSIQEEARHTEDPFFVVLEDDLVRTPQFDTMWCKVTEFLRSGQALEPWDMMTLDPILLLDAHNVRPSNHEYMLRVDAFRSMGFMIYSRPFLMNFDPSKEKNHFALDMTVTHSRQYAKLTPSKLCARQTELASDRVSLREMEKYRKYYDETELILASKGKRPRIVSLLVCLGVSVSSLLNRFVKT